MDGQQVENRRADAAVGSTALKIWNGAAGVGRTEGPDAVIGRHEHDVVVRGQVRALVPAAAQDG